MIRLLTLGSLDLLDDGGRPLQSVLAQPKRTGLLAFLALGAPGFRRRDTLLTHFWPESDEERGRAALSQALYFLRRSLGDGVVVARGDEDVGLASERVWCDVAAFEAALAADRLEEALQLYRGDLLTGFHLPDTPDFERWVERERGRLREAARAAALRLAEMAEAAGHFPRAIERVRMALALMPDDEAVLRRLVSLLDQSGDRIGAIREYERFARWLEEEFELEPAPETRELVAAVRQHAATPAAAQASAKQVMPATRAAPQEVASHAPVRAEPHTEPAPVDGDASSIGDGALKGLYALIAELKRRHVGRVAVLYGLLTWGGVELTTTAARLIGFPEWTPKLFLVVALVGFPIAMILAWEFDLTPSGLRRTRSGRKRRR